MKTAFVKLAPLKNVLLISNPVKSPPETSTDGPNMYVPRMVYFAGIRDLVASLYRILPPLLAAERILFVNTAFVMFVFVKYAFARLCPDKSAPLKSTLSPIMYPFLSMYFGFKYGVVPLIPPVLIFTKPEFIMFAFVIVTLLKSIPLKSLFDRSTPGPIMYPLRNENVLSGKTGSAGEATMFPDFIFRSFELVKSTPVKFVPLKSWSVKSFLVKSAYGPIKYPDTNLKPDPVENSG